MGFSDSFDFLLDCLIQPWYECLFLVITSHYTMSGWSPCDVFCLVGWLIGFCFWFFFKGSGRVVDLEESWGVAGLQGGVVGERHCVRRINNKKVRHHIYELRAISIVFLQYWTLNSVVLMLPCPALYIRAICLSLSTNIRMTKPVKKRQTRIKNEQHILYKFRARIRTEISSEAESMKDQLNPIIA